MKVRRELLIFLVLALGLCGALAQDASVKVAYVKDNEIFTLTSNGKPQQLTFDSIPKYYPLWSKDGTKLAFLREVDSGIALGNLIIIDPQTGNVLSNILICPRTPGVVYAVHSIDGIEWLTNDKIAATGLVNPSTEQTFVYSLQTNKELMDYPDDGGGAAFSPDGEHAASLDGMQHWLPASEQEPELDIDNRRVYPAKGAHVYILSQPAWSADSSSVAAIVEDYQSKQRSIVICSVKGDCERTAFSTSGSSPDDRFFIQWIGKELSTFLIQRHHGVRVIGLSGGTWSLKPGDTHVVASKALPNPAFESSDTKTTRYVKVQELGGNSALSLLKQVEKVNGRETDFWCLDCGFAKLPRKSMHM